MKFKKALLTLGTISSIAAPVATVVACGSSGSKEEQKVIDGQLLSTLTFKSDAKVDDGITFKGENSPWDFKYFIDSVTKQIYDPMGYDVAQVKTASGKVSNKQLRNISIDLGYDNAYETYMFTCTGHRMEDVKRFFEDWFPKELKKFEEKLESKHKVNLEKVLDTVLNKNRTSIQVEYSLFAKMGPKKNDYLNNDSF